MLNQSKLNNTYNELIIKKKNPKEGFSLAEVLITLGIIGVVASMTIPTLMNNIQEKQFKEAAKVAFSKSSQVVQQMKLDQGGTIDRSNYAFCPAFKTYFKVLKDYNSGDYTPITTAAVAPDIYKTLSGNIPNLFLADDGQFMTTDGMFFGIENAGAPLYITVDVNGHKQLNVYGKDTFMFDLVNDNLIPMGAQNSAFPAPANCDKNNTSQFGSFGCMYNVMQGIDY